VPFFVRKRAFTGALNHPPAAGFAQVFYCTPKKESANVAPAVFAACRVSINQPPEQGKK
jgi:hypothetical protein